MSIASNSSNTPITFVAFDAGPYFFPDAEGSLGGAETQIFLISKAVAQHTSHPVTVIVRDSVVRSPVVVNDVLVITLADRLFRIRWFVSERATVLSHFPWIRLRSFHPGLIGRIMVLAINRLCRLQRQTVDSPAGYETAILKTKGGVIGCKGVSNRTAGLFSAAIEHGMKTILFVAANSDLDQRYASDSTFVNGHGDSATLCASAIRSASVIACQTRHQQELLQQNFGRSSILFPNAFDEAAWLMEVETARRSRSVTEDRYVLWIGRSDRQHKRPHLVLEVARRCPDISILMIMNTHDSGVAAEIQRNRPENLQIVERVPFEQMPSCFSRAAILLSTSSGELEGFPNVFLQAAASSVPIVSLEADPGFITAHRAGAVCSGDFELLISELRMFWSSNSLAGDAGQNGYQYVMSHHSMKETASILESLIESAAASA